MHTIAENWKKTVFDNVLSEAGGIPHLMVSPRDGKTLQVITTAAQRHLFVAKQVGFMPFMIIRILGRQPPARPPVCIFKGKLGYLGVALHPTYAGLLSFIDQQLTGDCRVVPAEIVTRGIQRCRSTFDPTEGKYG